MGWITDNVDVRSGWWAPGENLFGRLHKSENKLRWTLPEEELFSSFVAYSHILKLSRESVFRNLNPNASKHGLY